MILAKPEYGLAFDLILDEWAIWPTMVWVHVYLFIHEGWAYLSIPGYCWWPLWSIVSLYLEKWTKPAEVYFREGCQKNLVKSLVFCQTSHRLYAKFKCNCKNNWLFLMMFCVCWIFTPSRCRDDLTITLFPNPFWKDFQSHTIQFLMRIYAWRPDRSFLHVKLSTICPYSILHD